MAGPSGLDSPTVRKRFERVAKMVALLAYRVHRKFPEVPVDELRSLGHEAAVEASRSFDETRGIPFEVFAFKRVRGAMIRASTQEVFDPVHAAVRHAIKTQAGLDLTPPAQVDLETALEDTPEKIRERTVQWLRAQAAAMLSAALVTHQSRSDTPQGEDAIAARDAYEKGHAHLANAIEKLPTDERALFEELYRKSATLDQAAKTLDIPKRSLQRLNEKMKERIAKQLRRHGVTEEPPLEGRPG